MVRRTDALIIAVTVVWVAGVSVGFRALWAYSGTPGKAEAPASTDWPHPSALRPSAERATLVMFLHPRCPCSRASIHELDRLLTTLRGELEARVVFTTPPDVPEGWESGELLDRAREIAGVAISVDRGAVEARRFGASTSGHCVVYDARGRFLFRGGITAARAHQGDSAGRERIIALVRTGHADANESAVFGCGLTAAE